MKLQLPHLLRRCLAPPAIAGDDEQTRQVHVLHAVICGVIVLASLVFLVHLVGSEASLRQITTDLLMLLMFVAMYAWLRRGRVKLVKVLLMTTAFSAITLVIGMKSSLHPPASTGYLMLVVIASMLFDQFEILIVTAICSLTMLGLLFARQNGLLPDGPDNAILSNWLTLTLFYILAAYMTYYGRYNAEQARAQLTTEVHERQRAEVEMRKLLRTVEQNPASIIITGLDQCIEYVNPRFLEISGFNLQEVIGKKPHMLSDTLRNPDIERELHETLHAGKVWSGELSSRSKSGERYYGAAIVSPITDRNGVTTHYMGIMQDITEQRRIQDALRTSEARYRALFEQTHDAVFILDLNGKHLAANQRAAEMLGYTTEEITQISVNDTSAEIDRSFNVMGKLLAGEHVPIYERRFRKKNGQVFPVEINVELVRDQKGQPLHLQSVVRDISQRKSAEEELQTAYEQLRLRVAEVERLQAELHEQALRDPLTGLYNRRYLSDTLEREIIRTQRANECLSVIIADIDHFKNINDEYGHQAGDRYLIEVARLFQRYTRASDLVCRYGGEEFLLIMPGTNSVTAQQRAEEIRATLASTTVEIEGQAVATTMSLGVATFPMHGSTGEEIIICADRALYRSKRNGRNRVSVCPAKTGRLHDIL